MCGIVFDVEVSGCRALVSRSMYGWSGKFCWLVFIVLLVGRLSWNLGQVAFSGGSGLNLFLPYLLPRGFLAFLAYLYCLPKFASYNLAILPSFSLPSSQIAYLELSP